jgi:hypothetical protein
MAEIKVDKDDRHYGHDHEHKKRRFPMWLLAIPVLGLLLLPMLNNNNDERAAAPPAATITYQGETWRAAGPAQTISDNDVRVLDRTSDGRSLYVSRDADNAGGGGGAGVADLEDRTLFLRTGQNQYVPLVETNDGVE